MNAQEIEQEIQQKGLTASRITLLDLEATIKSEYYFTALDGAVRRSEQDPLNNVVPVQDMDNLGLLTFCVLLLHNGFTVTGESACVRAENFDPELGKKIARRNAVEKLWPLLG